MTSDLDRLLRAVRTLRRLLGEYGEEAVTEGLGRFATAKQENVVWAVGAMLDKIGQELSSRRVHSRCPECGEMITAGLGRADAVYCSAGCKQAAYRARVAANTAKPKRMRNGTSTSLRMERKKKQRAITLMEHQVGAIADALGIDRSMIDKDVIARRAADLNETGENETGESEHEEVTP